MLRGFVHSRYEVSVHNTSNYSVWAGGLVTSARSGEARKSVTPADDWNTTEEYQRRNSDAGGAQGGAEAGTMRFPSRRKLVT
jgi:hypothetical protein